MVPTLEEPNRTRRSKTPSVVDLLTLLAIVFGLVARVVLLRSSLGALNSDEAVVGLMAEHVLHGEHPTFYWGQTYGGTIEVYLVAALFRAFGPGTLALKLVPILLWAFAAVLVWRVASRFVPRPQARLVGALFWALPAYSVWKSEHEEGYYGVLLVCGVLIVLTALVLAERGASLFGVAILGLLCGLGWWSSPQIAILAVPSIVWLAGRRGFVVRAWAFAPGFVVGALPWLLANVGRGWPSLHDRTAGSTWLDRLHALVSVTLPTALGLRVPYSLGWIPDTVIGAALYARRWRACAWSRSAGGASSPCL